jgi:hypothetical protein
VFSNVFLILIFQSREQNNAGHRHVLPTLNRNCFGRVYCSPPIIGHRAVITIPIARRAIPAPGGPRGMSQEQIHQAQLTALETAFLSAEEWARYD